MKRSVIRPLLLYAFLWLAWGIFQLNLPHAFRADTAGLLLENIAIKGLLWGFAPLMILFLGRVTRLYSISELFISRFPWRACGLICLIEAVFLFGLRIQNGLLHTFCPFDPMMLVLSLSAGIFEELTFRGWLFNEHCAAIGFWPAAIVNGALFTVFHYPGLLHGDFGALLSLRALLIFVMGMVFCYMLYKWKNLFLNMLAHTVWDVLSYLFCLAG